MPNSWRDLGMVICDPLADLHPDDAELWLSLIMLSINHNELELVSTLIAARQFGQRVEASPKFGYRLTKAEFFQEYFSSVYLKNRDASAWMKSRRPTSMISTNQNCLSVSENILGGRYGKPS